MGPGLTGDNVDTRLSAPGARAPVTYAVTSGSLPDGVTMTPDGHLVGTYRGTGATAAIVTATDADGRTGRIEIASAVATTTASVDGLPTFARALSNFTGSLATNIANPTWTVASVPSDLALSQSGNSLSVAAPAVTSRTVYTISARAARATGATAGGDKTVTVYPTLAVNGVSPSYSTKEGSAFSLAPAVAAGALVGAPTWAQAGLPTGIGMASNGTVSGTPPGGTAGSYNVRLTLSDGGDPSPTGTATQAFTLNVTPAVLLSASPATLTGLTQTAGAPGTCSTVAVTNSGSLDASGLAFSAATTSAPTSANAFQTCSPTAPACAQGSSLPKGATCNIGARMSAASAGSYTGTLTLTATGQSPVTVALQGTATVAPVAEGFRIFSTAGNSSWTPPRQGMSVRYLVMGGGAGGYENYYKAGGSGYLKVGTMTVTSSPLSITVGSGSVGNISGTPATPAQVSMLGDIQATGGDNSNGWSGGGGAYPYAQGTAGSANGGKNGSGGSGQFYAGTGTGAVNLSMFVKNALTAGDGGQGISDTYYSNQCGPNNTNSGGGGGGGILINGAGGTAFKGGNKATTGNPGKGWGAGGGGASRGANCTNNNDPGTGSTGLVYLEWDAQ